VVNDELCTSVNSHTLSIVEGNQCILSWVVTVNIRLSSCCQL
jgi:hypothetical protein